MAENLGKWPSGRGPISKTRPLDGCKGDTVPLAVERWYDFHGFGCHLGNVGLDLFGASVAVSGNVAVVGAHSDDPGGVSEAGTAYVFDTAFPK